MTTPAPEPPEVSTQERIAVELLSMADLIEARVEQVRAMGGQLNAYGAVEMLRTRARQLDDDDV